MCQIGYMMLAAGLGPIGYAFAIFHLLTHGFFKAGHVPRRRLGHARHERPGRHAPVRRPLVGHPDHGDHLRPGCLAIIGFPFLDGFWSKDKIIESAFTGEGWRPWVFGVAALIGAGDHRVLHVPPVLHDLPGKKRWTDDVHPHESPAHDHADDRARVGRLSSVDCVLSSTGPSRAGSTRLPAIATRASPSSRPGRADPDPRLVAAGVALAWRMYPGAAGAEPLRAARC